MKARKFILILLCLIATNTMAAARSYTDGIAVEIIADNGSIYPVYEIDIPGNARTRRAYLEAINGKNYRVRVRNLENHRIGLVIAVDGRNIITGGQSNLRSTEQMYILGPYEQASYDGWRTSQRQVHRFYFTDVENSYAGSWGDHSAMGVIAVAAFHEKIRPVPQRRLKSESGKSSSPSPMAEAELAEDIASQPGTGFGNKQYSPVRIVQFDPQSRPAEKIFYKYEWHETLCIKGILNCRQPKNRLWPDNQEQYGYAPYPPEYK
jgi:hypothetical protein